MEKVAAYSFSLNIRVMKVIGLYPSNSHQSLHKIYAHVIYILAMIPATTLGLLHFVFTEDITNFTYNDFIMVAMVFYTFKFLPFVKNSAQIKNCIHYFDDPFYTVVQEKHREIVEECVDVCRRNSKVFFVGCIAGLTGFIGQAVLNLEQLPLNVWIPKFVKERALCYHIVHFLVMLGAVYAVLACGTIDPLIGGLVHQAAAQVQVLKENLQHLDAQVHNESVKYEAVYFQLKNCVQRHQKILNFVKEYQECFSPVVFSQFAGSSLVIGLLCFQISKLLTIDVTALIMMNYLSVLFFQIFFYCYYGTLLIEESKTLPNAVYMSKWYECSIGAQKALGILMERSQKPMVVTAGKLFDLSLVTFTTILRRAYSLLAVLKNY
ncbi:odorant receptor 94a-like [Zophobas morio]|uniref:odorant receptor 94a-like n=1 Tax=Zophobas morio TaxID=2755281 RepID=UPI0030837598